MTSTANVELLVQDFLNRYPSEAARALLEVDPDDALATIDSAAAPVAAGVLSRLGPDTAAAILRRLPADHTQRVLAAADPSVTVALLNRLGEDFDRQAYFSQLTAAQRRDLESYLAYPEDSAGSLMDPLAPIFREDARAADVAAALRESGRVDAVVMVVDDEGVLTGTLPTVKVLLAGPETRLAALKPQHRPSIEAFAHRDEVAEAIEARRLTAMPVVNINDQPVGLLSHSALARVAEQEAATDMQSMVGVSREERALSSVGFAVRKRLPWLQINLATAFLAASVVGMFEETIATFTALAVLLPVVAGQSGNTGAQSLAVTMRGLTLHEISLRQWLPVIVKESSVGLLNGIAVALVTMVGVWIWSGSFGLCAVIGIAMVTSMTVAGIAGAGVPLVLRAVGQDPAQSSSIVLTTVTDIVGFFSFLALATAMASWLTP